MIHSNHYALLNPLTNNYYLNAIGTPLLFPSLDLAEEIISLEIKYYNVLDGEYIPVEMTKEDLKNINKITMSHGVYRK